MENVNQNKRILYAVFEHDIQLPILDITHPLFNASIDEQAYHLSCLKSAKSIESLKKMPGFIRNIFLTTPTDKQWGSYVLKRSVTKLSTDGVAMSCVQHL
ncbi:hypothetical protein ABH966_000998 [Lysinibacillus sp. RC46]|uniref:hypothetical protein n=1 Tax=unclassified Lysinibacillus TaxID=2636778 RepID=UPI003513B9A6